MPDKVNCDGNGRVMNMFVTLLVAVALATFASFRHIVDGWRLLWMQRRRVTLLNVVQRSRTPSHAALGTS